MVTTRAIAAALAALLGFAGFAQSDSGEDAMPHNDDDWTPWGDTSKQVGQRPVEFPTIPAPTA